MYVTNWSENNLLQLTEIHFVVIQICLREALFNFRIVDSLYYKTLFFNKSAFSWWYEIADLIWPWKFMIFYIFLSGNCQFDSHDYLKVAVHIFLEKILKEISRVALLTGLKFAIKFGIKLSFKYFRIPTVFIILKR